MKQLEELEKKIAQIIEYNKRLKDSTKRLEQEKKSLMEINEKLEASFLKEHKNVDSLANEKNSIKDAIEVLLKNIGAVETLKEK